MSEQPEPPVSPGNPPREHRWQKGCPSPNPGGRPPRKKIERLLAPLDDYAEMVTAIGSKQLQGKDGTPIELRSQYISHLIEIALDKKTPATVRAEILLKLSQLDREALRILEEKKQKQYIDAPEYKEKFTDRFRQYDRRGLPLPKGMPHPDDIILTNDGRVVIVGPKTLQQQEQLKLDLLKRDAMAQLFEQYSSQRPSVQQTKNLKYCRRELAKINKAVPPRLVRPVPPLPMNAKT